MWLVIGVVLVVSKHIQVNTSSLTSELFENADGTMCPVPCLFGVYPGHILGQDDERRLAGLGWMKDITLTESNLSGWFDMNGQGVTFFADSTKVAIYQEIWDGFSSQQRAFLQLSFGDIIANIGSPSVVLSKDDFGRYGTRKSISTYILVIGLQAV